MMKEVLPQTDAIILTNPPGAPWYQAMTLTERISLGQPNSPHLAFRKPDEQERAAQRLNRWKSQEPFRRLKQSFEQRLEMDGLTEESLLALLGQPAAELQAHFSEQPAWLVEFFDAVTRPDPAILASLPLEHIGDPPTDAAFQALKPLLARGFARIQAGVAQLQQRYTRLPFDPQTVSFLLLPQFLNLFLNKPARTLILEVNVARIQGDLQGETPEERFLYFLQQLTQPERLLTFYEEYPVLARQLVELIERWVGCSLELLQRLCADWDEIRDIFAPRRDPGLLTEIKAGAGDTHQGGRSVTILTWSSGLRIVYKPRSLAIDEHFQQLLAWLNTQGCLPAFRTALLLNKQTYGWYEYFSTDGCATREEVERFYQRMGGYLALFYILEATDFHAENLLAAGENPMFIDLESLFQPHAVKYEGPDAYGYEILTHSVRRSGLLPQHNWFGGKATNIDLSSLGGPGIQRSGATTGTRVETLTDDMYIKKEEAEIKLSTHRPTLQGKEVNVLEYEQSVIAGFTRVYLTLLQHRDELLHTILPRFAHDEIRIILRPTIQYTAIHADCFHPDVLRDALDRERLFHRLWTDTEQSPYLARVIAAERTDLQYGDIPRFTTHPASCDLFTSQNECIADFFPVSGLDLAKNGIKGMGENDLARQIWLISASFACMEMNRTSIKPKRDLPLRLTDAVVTRLQFLIEARSIADRLLQLALIGEETAGWLVVNLVGGQEWRPVPAGLDLYNGLTGIILFLAYLGMVSKEERYTKLAQLTTERLQRLLLPHWPWQNIGAFDGLGSLLYLFAHLGTIWHAPKLYQDAEKLVSLIPALISLDNTFDVLNGSAGCIAALLSLHAVAPHERTLATAIQCGDHLLSHARSMRRGIAWSPREDLMPLAGFSHGNAGIALSLLRLAAATGEKRFQEAALAALEYERSIFSPERNNWPDLRETPVQPDLDSTQSYRYMTAWCHGAPGIALARIASLQFHADATIRAEIEAAVQTTLKEGFGSNHSLCHGDMGNLEVLLLAGRLFPDRYAGVRETIQSMLLESIQTCGWQSGIPYPMETPGLMLGLAGTGYALLRQFAPEQIPSVLVLDAPNPG